ncbi:Stp1/IreP family PP2C-type Ser/Thr phosphatase [Alkalibaculum sp. M08DMB]|uniref:Stp1/IreP family PP2C-type Ser/Thr phosphatase n=1 Tax=Alkalibaculum sporogenes TaxID=2655001 RepID=A0A6A7K9K3_9FIRM|nr:Stp1/IreP family PP2C-type Ser/Thr phosphatase [Alkalibaculum sporogenes]MPW26035.1 Stp1/IreP family PP2C-type Ser/Thr phosphatase [Alkalibaculum sporogenes]
MNLGYKSHIGKVRTVNQDAYFVLDNPNSNIKVFAVADGLGGHNAGEVASNMLIEKISDTFNQSILINGVVNQDIVIEKIKSVNREIFEKGIQNEHLNKMGTTLSLTVIVNEIIYIFHVGDSRTYIVNQKEILQLTKDHSLVEQLVMQGEISRQEAENHPNKNVLTRAIGTDQEIEIDFYKYAVKKSDKILLCTDGLTNLLNTEEIKEIINNNNCKDAVEELIDKANEYGGFDNITAIVYEPEVSL